MRWIKNSRGNPDALLSIVVVTMGVVLLKLLLAGIVVGKLAFGELDASVVAAVLTPTLGAYVARRATEKRTTAPSDR